jgi:hypothetical protein
VALGVEAMAGFPSLNTLPHAALLGHHGVNVHGCESRNKSMIIQVHIRNIYEGKKMEDLAREMVKERTCISRGVGGCYFDSLFKYEEMLVTPGSPARVVSTPLAPNGLGSVEVESWKDRGVLFEKNVVFLRVMLRCYCMFGLGKVRLMVLGLDRMTDECCLLGLKGLEFCIGERL